MDVARWRFEIVMPVVCALALQCGCSQDSREEVTTAESLLGESSPAIVDFSEAIPLRPEIQRVADETLSAVDSPPLATSQPEAHQPKGPRPLPRRKPNGSSVREVIEEELFDDSAEDRDIWFEELQHLPAEVVRDILKLRREVREQLAPSEHFAERERPLDPPKLGPVPAPVVSEVAPHPAMTQALLGIVRENIRNARVMGYRRRLPLLLEDVSAEATANSQIPILALRLSPRMGEAIETRRALDCMIASDGGWYFYVRSRAGRDAVTRRGDWQVDAELGLVLMCGGEAWQHQPPVVPAPGLRCRLRANGEVWGRPSTDAAASATALGRLQIVELLDSSAVQHEGHGLYISRRPSDKSWFEPIDAAQSSVLNVGYLEGCAVHLEEELELERALIRPVDGSDSVKH